MKEKRVTIEKAVLAALVANRYGLFASATDLRCHISPFLLVMTHQKYQSFF